MHLADATNAGWRSGRHRRLLGIPRKRNRAASLLTSLLLLASVVPGETANETTAPTTSPLLCACQPAAYEIALDFNVSCDDRTVTSGLDGSNPGIIGTACITNKETDQNVTDFTPVTIHAIQFIEHNENVNPIQQVRLDGEFVNGDVVNFTSELANTSSLMNNFTELSIPRTLQMILRGNNAADQDIQLIWFIKYSDSCDAMPPLLVIGQTMGWSEFVSATRSTCSELKLEW
jgi:hypothetical protein